MTNSFPNFPKDPDTTPEWYNDATEEWYDWNTDTQAWRRRSAAEGGGGPLIPDVDVDAHQDGTLDDRYVEVLGDTMKGDLIQFPSEDVYPSNEGELATAVPDGKEIEFRYMNAAGDTVCASLPLTPCGKSIDPVIAIDGSAETFADYGEDLILVSDGVVPNGTLDDQVWEVSDNGIIWTNSPATAPPTPYTVMPADQGKMYRVAQTFLDDTDGSPSTVYSNAISVTNDPPPIVNWIGWTHTGGSAIVTVGRKIGAGTARIFKSVGSSWEELPPLVTSSSSLDPGTYIIEADPLRSVRFFRSDNDITFNLSAGSYTQDLESMENAFTGLTKFNQDLTGFDWSSVTNWDDAMSGCSSYNANVSGLITGVVTTIARMLKGTAFDKPVTSWNVENVTNMIGLFENTPFNQSLAGWDTSKVEKFASMFYGTTAFNQSVDGLSIVSATDMSAMFRAAEAYNQPITSWVFPAGCNVAGLFAYTKVFNSELSFNTSGLTSIKEMFEGAEVFNHPSIRNWDVSNVESLLSTFNHTKVFNQDLETWDTGKVTNFRLTFANNYIFDGNISNWNVSSGVEFHGMFYTCYEFNKNLNNWNTSSAVDMSSLFFRCRKLNYPLDKWSTGTVENMDRMFSGCYEFNQDISTWCVPLISSSPEDFSASSHAGFRDVPNAKHPKWGTCPPRILTNPVIK